MVRYYWSIEVAQAHPDRETVDPSTVTVRLVTGNGEEEEARPVSRVPGWITEGTMPRLRDAARIVRDDLGYPLVLEERPAPGIVARFVVRDPMPAGIALSALDSALWWEGIGTGREVRIQARHMGPQAMGRWGRLQRAGV